MNDPIDFWTFFGEMLDTILGNFWFSARQLKVDEHGNQKKYTVQSLHSLR